MTTTDAEFGVFCPGMLEVLSIGKGDLKLSVGDNDDDRAQAQELIEEMLRKGYSIFVETDDGPERVTGFNPRRMTYTIGAPAIEAAGAERPAQPALPAPAKKRAPRKKRTREVPVGGTRATAVGRTAGG